MTASPKALQRQAQLLADIVGDLCIAVEDGFPADGQLARLYRAHREFGSRDRRLFTEAAFAYFRWKGWVESGAKELLDQIALAFALDGHPPHPALPDVSSRLDETRRLEPTLLVPPWLKDHVPNENFSKLVDSFQKRPPVWLRAKRGHAEELIHTLDEIGRAGARPSQDRTDTGGTTSRSSVPDAICFDGSVNLDLVRKKIGCVFEVQDLASQRVGLACAAQPGESWWDACAGAGGKSLHLADLMENRGEILATDVREEALEKLEARARRSRATIIKTSAQPPLHTLFDGVLVDAPCSGIGTWSRNPDARWRTTEEMIAEKSTVQRNLLETAAARVKPGGKLVYAVCTVTRKETTEVTEAFLGQHPEFSPSVHPSIRPTLQLWPWDGPCDGMFISALKKELHRSYT